MSVVLQEQVYVDNELPVDLAFDRAERRRRLLLASFLALVQLSLVFFMFTVALAKIIEHGIYPYICHFTNWSWTLQLLFYTLTLPAPFVLLGFLSTHNVFARLSQTTLFIGFFPLHGIVWTVMMAVTVLLGTKSPFLTDIFNIYPPEIVIIGNDLFHSYPVLVLLIYTIAYRRLLFYAINRVIARKAILDDPWRFGTLLFYQAYFGAGTALAVYTVIFDPRRVYRTELPVLGGVFVAFATLTAFNLVPLLVVLALKGVASRDAYSRLWLLRNLADPALIPLESRAPRVQGGKLV